MMKKRARNHTVSARRRVATAKEVDTILSSLEEKKGHADLAKQSSIPLPPQAPVFLRGLPPAGVSYTPVYPITQKLKHLIEANRYDYLFEQAIERVCQQNIPELDRITNIDQFYFYIDCLVQWIPEIRVWAWYGELLHERTPYVRLTQFYYYFNQDELEALQSPIDPIEGNDLSPISAWLREFAVAWGSFLDTEASAKYLESFMYAPEYAWQDYAQRPTKYRTFNQFFAREFSNIDQLRPVAAKNNDRIIVFPAESTFVGQWAVSTDVGDPLPCDPSVVVKHIEWSIKELLADTDYKDVFAGGLFCHSFLNTFDYHRQHTPVRGTVLEAKFIPGQVYLKVNLEDRSTDSGKVARAVIPQRYLDADDPTGYQFIQCRGLLVLDSPIGKVAILPIGMAQVSSVIFVTSKADGHQPIVLDEAEQEGLSYNEKVNKINAKIHNQLVGKTLEKGEMFSYFQFGGSDCVMIFERTANVTITAQQGVHYPIRSQYAIENP